LRNKMQDFHAIHIGSRINTSRTELALNYKTLKLK